MTLRRTNRNTGRAEREREPDKGYIERRNNELHHVMEQVKKGNITDEVRRFFRHETKI